MGGAVARRRGAQLRDFRLLVLLEQLKLSCPRGYDLLLDVLIRLLHEK